MMTRSKNVLTAFGLIALTAIPMQAQSTDSRAELVVDAGWVDGEHRSPGPDGDPCRPERGGQGERPQRFPVRP